MIGTKVLFSPVGEGTITDFTQRGYPRVNLVAVGWLITDSYEVIDATGVLRQGKYTLVVCSDPKVIKERNFNGTIAVASEEEASKLIEAIGTHPFKLEVIED